MQFRHGIFTALGAVSMVAACAQTAPEPEPIQAEPIYNKYGEPTGQCTGGYDYNSQTQTCEPPQCNDGYDSQGMPCDILHNGGGDDNGGGDNNSQGINDNSVSAP